MWAVLLGGAIYCGLHLFSKHTVRRTPDYKYGCVDRRGNMVVKPLYDEIAPFSCDRSLIVKSGKYGFIDLNGNLVVQPNYDLALSFTDDLAAVLKNGKWGFISKHGEFAIQPQFSNAASFSEGLAAVTQDGSCGYIDKRGNWVLKPQFLNAGQFQNGVAVVRAKPYWEFTDASGKIHRRENIENVYPSAAGESLAAASIQSGEGDAFGPYSLWGAVDSSGAFVIPPDYNSKPIIRKNRLICSNSEFASILDRSGKSIAVFKNVLPIPETEFLLARKDDKWGIVDLDGKFLLPARYHDLESISADLFIAQADEKWGILDAHGTAIVPLSFKNRDDALSINLEKRGGHWIAGKGKTGFELLKAKSTLQSFSSGTKFGAKDSKGKILIPAKFDRPVVFDDACEFSINETEGNYVILDTAGHVYNDVTVGSGRAHKFSSAAGLVDVGGHWIVPPHVDEIGEFRSGLAPFRINQKWGIMNRQGQVLVKPTYDGLKSFSNDGLAAVQIKDKWGFVNRLGELTISPRFSKTGGFSEGRAWVFSDGKAGYIDTRGDLIVEPKYVLAADFSCGRALIAEANVGRANKLNFAFINMSGKQILGPYNLADSFVDGLAPVNLDGSNWQMIDTAGEAKIKFKHLQLGYEFEKHMLKFSQDRMPVLIER